MGHHATFDGRASRFYSFGARWAMRGVYRRIAEDIAHAAPQDSELLDVGTGPGWLLDAIARLRPDVRLTGVDLSADMVSAAERNLGDRATVRVGAAENLPFPDETFDLVVSSFSLHHWGDPGTAVPELARVLRPGGRLYFYDFGSAPFNTVDRAAEHGSLFTGQPVRHTVIRTGAPHIRRCVRRVLTS